MAKTCGCQRGDLRCGCVSLRELLGRYDRVRLLGRRRASFDDDTVSVRAKDRVSVLQPFAEGRLRHGWIAGLAGCFLRDCVALFAPLSKDLFFLRYRVAHRSRCTSSIAFASSVRVSCEKPCTEIVLLTQISRVLNRHVRKLRNGISQTNSNFYQILICVSKGQVAGRCLLKSCVQRRGFMKSVVGQAMRIELLACSFVTLNWQAWSPHYSRVLSTARCVGSSRRSIHSGGPTGWIVARCSRRLGSCVLAIVRRLLVQKDQRS